MILDAKKGRRRILLVSSDCYDMKKLSLLGQLAAVSEMYGCHKMNLSSRIHLYVDIYNICNVM